LEGQTGLEGDGKSIRWRSEAISRPIDAARLTAIFTAGDEDRAPITASLSNAAGPR
jgi:hypothetical protein